MACTNLGREEEHRGERADAPHLPAATFVASKVNPAAYGYHVIYIINI